MKSKVVNVVLSFQLSFENLRLGGSADDVSFNLATSASPHPGAYISHEMS